MRVREAAASSAPPLDSGGQDKGRVASATGNLWRETMHRTWQGTAAAASQRPKCSRIALGGNRTSEQVALAGIGADPGEEPRTAPRSRRPPRSRSIPSRASSSPFAPTIAASSRLPGRSRTSERSILSAVNGRRRSIARLAIAGAEIVECQSDADVAQGGQQQQRVVVDGQQRRFRQLQFHGLRRQAGGPQRPWRPATGKARSLQLAWRDVDRQNQPDRPSSPRPQRIPRSGPRHRFAPISPVCSASGMNRSGGIRPRRRCGPADNCFRPDGHTRRKRHSWLVVQDERTRRRRLLQVLVQAAKVLRLGPRLLRVEHGGIAPPDRSGTERRTVFPQHATVRWRRPHADRL